MPKYYSYLLCFRLNLNHIHLLETIMEDELDYEDMDDLALSEHIEWNHDRTDEFTMDAADSIYS